MSDSKGKKASPSKTRSQTTSQATSRPSGQRGNINESGKRKEKSSGSGTNGSTTSGSSTKKMTDKEMAGIKNAERRPERRSSKTQPAMQPIRRVSKSISDTAKSPRKPPSSRGVRKTTSMDSGVSPRGPPQKQAAGRLAANGAHSSSPVPPKPASTSRLITTSSPTSSSSSSQATASATTSLSQMSSSLASRRAPRGNASIKKPASMPKLSKAAADTKSRVTTRSSPPAAASASSPPTSAFAAKAAATIQYADEDMAIVKQREEKDAMHTKNRSAREVRAQAVAVRPGAYSVQGEHVQRRAVSASQLTPQEAQLIQTEHDLMSLNSAKYHNARQQQGMSPISSSLPTVLEIHESSAMTQQPSNLVVAAELSSDAEADIAKRVRQQLLQSAAQADVVAVRHGKGISGATVVYSVDDEEEQKRIAAFKELHRPKGAKERIFGDSRKSTDAVDIAATPECIRKRDLLKWTLKRNKATNQWVASVTTNQKALEAKDTVEIERSICSFTAPTQKEAFEIGLSMAVPLMHAFDDNPICFICKAKFALLRRPSHCRNCGICICSNCTITWPSRMVPSTYNPKNLSQLKVCLACDWLSSTFSNALLLGRHKTAADLYSTGNVNLRASAYSKERGAEICHPVHLAVIGGNIKLVEWLCSEHFCPLRVAGKGRKSPSPLLTSKGRSVLSIALQDTRKLDIVRYLIADQGMALNNEKDLSNAVVMSNLTALITMLPKTFFLDRNAGGAGHQQPSSPRGSFDGSSSSLS